ncbi:MAG: glycoside hydrolase family 15 protein, partial [Gemmatimonadaceae bacterium]
LGSPANGRWQIAPVDADPRVTRWYRGDTLILETDFETDGGAVRVTDFMPVRGGHSDLVRIVTGLRGRVDMRTEIVLRFAYGNVVPWVHRLDDGRLRAIAGPDMVIIRSDVELHGVGRTTVGDFSIAEGDRSAFVMTWGAAHLAPPDSVDPEKALASTERFWTEWAAQCTYRGEWRDAVMRSLLTLKALTFEATGGIVAAPTTSLPEQVGGVRNWDYRYCWLRDATITLRALMSGGYYHEAQAWRDWLVRAAAGSPSQVQIMYGLSGERFLWEWDVPWLPGYENSRPVRIGNAAHEQLQLDVFGEVMDALHHASAGGIPASREAWHFQQALMAHLETLWTSPDQGIWETRGRPQHFTHSKVMAWVAMDRAVRSIEEYGLDGPLE